MNRPLLDNVFMEVARIWAQRSTCLGRKVGAVLVQGKHQIATGYNGVPSGAEHCTDRQYCREVGKSCVESCLKSRAVHAEMNAIAQAAKLGIATDGATLYTTLAPCQNCFLLVVSAGVKAIVYQDDNPGMWDAIHAVYGGFAPIEIRQYKSEVELPETMTIAPLLDHLEPCPPPEEPWYREALKRASREVTAKHKATLIDLYGAEVFGGEGQPFARSQSKTGDRSWEHDTRLEAFGVEVQDFRTIADSAIDRMRQG